MKKMQKYLFRKGSSEILHYILPLFKRSNLSGKTCGFKRAIRNKVDDCCGRSDWQEAPSSEPETEREILKSSGFESIGTM